MWNEPNHKSFFERGDQKAYLDLYKVTSQVVRSFDDGCRIGGPATAGSAAPNNSPANSSPGTLTVPSVDAEE
ncbi:GH39 family glycosyl hydrolase [Asticcacaulis machinosus]|uniref:GH39 family glycosyl hydrolase n=1 Tax=Asticcacaulis machinosus TaxID=2984211 RepID=UPI0034A154B7